MNEALDGVVFFIQGLLFKVDNKGGLLQNSSIEDITLTVRKSSGEHLAKALAVKASRA